MSSSRSKLGGVYRINLFSGHFYVGRSSDINRRVQVHLRHLKQGRHENAYMQRVYDQNSQFGWEAVFLCTDSEESVRVEQSLLNELIGTVGCVNLNRSASSGPGMVGRRHTEAAKRKIREARSHRLFQTKPGRNSPCPVWGTSTQRVTRTLSLMKPAGRFPRLGKVWFSRNPIVWQCRRLEKGFGHPTSNVRSNLLP